MIKFELKRYDSFKDAENDMQRMIENNFEPISISVSDTTLGLRNYVILYKKGY